MQPRTALRLAVGLSLLAIGAAFYLLTGSRLPLGIAVVLDLIGLGVRRLVLGPKQRVIYDEDTDEYIYDPKQERYKGQHL